MQVRVHEKLAGNAIVGMAVLAVVWVGGCSANGDAGSGPAAQPTSADASPTRVEKLTPLRPITAASPGPDVSSPLQERASEGAIVDASRHGPTSADAERFALLFSQAPIDLREPVDMEGLLEEVATDDLPLSTRTLLLEAVDPAYNLGRYWYTDDPMWIQAQSVGRTGQPSSVMVEIAGSTRSTDYPGHSTWQLLRIDVVRAGDQWKISGLSSSGRRADPNDADPQLRDQLEGKGWRRVV